jgi:hypothetical protein
METFLCMYTIQYNSLRSQNARHLKLKNAATRSHLQPLEWPQVIFRASGRKVAASGHKWPLGLQMPVWAAVPLTI